MAAQACYITSDNTTALRVAFIQKHITSRPGVTNELREQGELLLGKYYTAVQAGRSRFRFPMVSMELIDIILDILMKLVLSEMTENIFMLSLSRPLNKECTQKSRVHRSQSRAPRRPGDLIL
jgi:hypothetical protein